MNWRHKIELNKVMSDVCDKHDLSRVEEDCPEEVKEALATEIEKAWPIAHFCKKIRSAKSIAAVNRILERVYNDADRHAVWCGL